MKAGLSIGPFEIENRIAQGAMGVVWKARHIESSKYVAIKFILEEKNDSWSQNQFDIEVQAIAGLDHRNICQILDHGQYRVPNTDQTIPYLVMEFIDGPDMFDLTGRISWTPLRRLILQLLDALAHAHARGFLHHDIKPSNVMLRRSDRQPWTDDSIIDDLEVVLMDFGLARAQGQINEERFVQGTPAYMPPEQLRCAQHHYGPWTDLYSVGCALWRLLTGSPPYGKGKSLNDYLYASESGVLPILHNQVAIPDALEKWLQTILHKNPRNRFQLAADAARELRELRSAERMPFQSSSLDDNTGTFTIYKVPSPVSDLTFSGLRTFVPTPANWRRRHPPRKWTHLSEVGLNLFPLRRTPMVGRINERDQLWQHLKEVQHMGSRLVTLSGVAGSGKTRLVEWLCERGEEFGCSQGIILECRTAMSLKNVQDIMRKKLGIEGLDSNQAFTHLNSEVHPSEAIFKRIGELIPLLHPENETHLPFNAEQFGEIWLDFLEHISYRDPKRCRVVLLHIEHIDQNPDFLSFCEWILNNERARRRPILMLMPIRSETIRENKSFRLRLAALHQNSHAFRLTVSPLSEEEETTLIERSLDLSPNLTQQITQRTKGLPLLSIQLIHELVMQKTLVAGNQGFVLAPGKKLDIPSHLKQNWSDQIQKLFQNAHNNDIKAVQAASAIGNHIHYDLWRRGITQLKLTYPSQLLNLLLSQNVIKKWPNQRGFSFSHPLYTQIIYKGADEHWLTSVHTTFAELLRPYKSLKQMLKCARHFTESQQYSKAFMLYVQCFNVQVKESKREEILKLLSTIRSLVDVADLKESSIEYGLWLNLQMEAANFEQDWTQFDTLKTKLHGLLKKFDWPTVNLLDHALNGRRLIHQGKILEAITVLRNGVEIKTPSDDPHPKLTRSGLRRCYIGLFDGYSHLDDIEELGQTLHRARPYFSQTEDQGHFLSYLHRGSFFYRRCSNYNKAEQLEQQALRIANDSGLIRHIAICQNNLGDMAKERKQFVAAREHFHKAYRLFSALNNMYAYLALYNLGATLVLEDQIEDAADIFNQVIQKSTPFDFQLITIYSYFQLLYVKAKLKDSTGWDDHLRSLQGLLQERHLYNPELEAIIDSVIIQSEEWSENHKSKLNKLLEDWLGKDHQFFHRKEQPIPPEK